MLLLFQGLLNHLASHEVRGHYKTSPSRFLTLLLLFVHSSLCIGLFHFIVYMVHHGCLKVEAQPPSPHPLLGQNPTVPHSHAQLCQEPATLTPESLKSMSLPIPHLWATLGFYKGNALQVEMMGMSGAVS